MNRPTRASATARPNAPSDTTWDETLRAFVPVPKEAEFGLYFLKAGAFIFGSGLARSTDDLRNISTCRDGTSCPSRSP